MSTLEASCTALYTSSKDTLKLKASVSTTAVAPGVVVMHKVIKMWTILVVLQVTGEVDDVANNVSGCALCSLCRSL